MYIHYLVHRKTKIAMNMYIRQHVKNAPFSNKSAVSLARSFLLSVSLNEAPRHVEPALAGLLATRLDLVDASGNT